MVGGPPRVSRIHAGSTRSPQGPGTLVGRVGLERRIVQIPDVLADPIYQWPIGRELGGYRTMLGAPMLAGDRVVGVLTLWRLEVDPFGDRTIDLLTTLAAQAAIAIQNVELFQQLTRSVEELRALGEISQAVSSSLDLDEVLDHDRANARSQLSGTEGGSIFEFDAAERALPAAHVRRHGAVSWSPRSRRRASTSTRRSSGAPRRAASRSRPRTSSSSRPIRISTELARGGWRSLLAVPLLWEQEIIGALVVRRKVDRRLPRPDGRAARDAREPVGGRHPQRPGVPRAAGSRAASSRSRAGTSRSSWRACRTSCGRRSTR